MSRLKLEIEEKALDSRIDKIAQPGREVLILHMRGREGNHKLLISASASSPRIHFTARPPENPKQPPMFCMLLRKRLGGGRLTAVTQYGLDRILRLDFDTVNELGDRVVLSLLVEIMGRHSNIILVDGENRIVDAVKRIDLTMSSVRQVLPGMSYVLPPSQTKLSLLEATADEIVQAVKAGRNLELSKTLMEVLQGVSPILARELAHYATRGMETQKENLSGEQMERLRFAVARLITEMKENTTAACMVMTPEGRPKDFSLIPIHQYGHALVTREYASCSELLDDFYCKRDQMERIKQRSADLLKLLVTISDRISRKLANQKEELAASQDRERLKRCGDLLSANLYSLRKGDWVAKVDDFYQESSPMVDIALDSRLTPAQNAQRYYGEYHKADTAEKMLLKLMAQGEEELEYIDSVFDALTRAESEAELTAIRGELAAQGYLRRQGKGPAKKEEKLAPIRYRSSDGFTILTGRNNLQNDRLTLRDSRGRDLWFHTQKIPGSHTVILTEGREVPNRTLEEACVIAAYNSKARESAKVPVDYTQVRNVKKPPGAKPGMVIYDHFQTAVVDPDEERVLALLEQE